jgi:serine/threonine protein kinase/Tol biopolymer transport system component
MTLVNQTVSHYKIVSQLGEGGMGEVYLAQDTKLDRKIALKVLPADVVSNRDRMERFVREAKSAAALNHPHIAHIYEIGESGSSPTVRQGVHFIAMEYIDGETLRENIHRHKVPLAKLLKYLTQVAEGLAKAHAAGIVHRDLKPDNIMITSDGFAKILDFGLAKLVEPQRPFDSGDAGSSEIATAVMQQHSIPGMVMGTAGYMSPEQAQGKTKAIDHRSDIFSFGCILFEAATGKRAFEGKDVLDSLHKIVHAPTPQIKEINPAAPDELQRIVRRCLAKEPEKRYQSIKEVAIELEELQQELKSSSELEYSAQPTSSGAVPPVGSTQTEGLHSSASGMVSIGTARSASSAEYLVSEIKRHKRGLLLALVALVVLVAGVAFGLYKWTGQRQRGGASQPLKITRLTSTGKATSAAISPDGKYVVYAQDEEGQESLWMAQVAVSSNVQIVPPAQANYWGITFSRDGNFIYYVRVDKDNPLGALYQAPALGGNPRKLLVNIASPVTFSPDGKQLAFIRAFKNENESALMIANADGTDEKELVTRKVPNNNFSGTEPAWSPDGKIIAFGQEDVKGGNYRNVVAVRVADGTEQPMTTKRWEGNYAPRIAWLSDNSGVLVTASEQAGNGAQIWFVAWPGGEARQVTNALNSYIDLSMTADSGTLAAVQSEAVINLWVSQTADLSRTRQITSGVGRNDGTRGIAWAPDGKIVYFSLAGGRQNIWMIDADGRGNKQLSADARRNRDPAVSPDGRYVVWQSNRTGNTNIWRMDIDGGALRQLTQSVEASSPRISPDGKWVVYQDHSNRGRRTTLWKVPIDGGTPMQLTETDSDWQVISPDGKLIAYTYSDEASGQIKIALIPFEGGPPASVFDLPPESRVSGTRISPIQWTPDGHALAFIHTSGGVSNIWTQPVDGSAQKQLTDFKDQRIFNFAWSRDGKQLALSRGVFNADVVLITGFK